MASNFKIQNFPSLLSVQVSQFSLQPMFLSLNFISRSTILPKFGASILFNRLHCLSLSSSTSPSPTSVSENSSIEHSFEVSSLINTFGWPPELAISKAKNLKVKSPEKPERILDYFKKHGFTETQISLILEKHPRLLVYNPEKTFLPKFEFLRSLGLSTTEITVAVTKAPYFLTRSLENTIKPGFKHLRSLVNSYYEAVEMVIQSPRRLFYNTEPEDSSIESSFEVSYLIKKFGWPPEVAISNAKNLNFRTPEKPERILAFLKNYGFTETQISVIVKSNSRYLLSNPEKFLPNLEFLSSLGLSTTEITDVVTKEPYILVRSLENAVKPAFKLLRSLVDSDDEAVKMVKQYPVSLTRNKEDENSVQILLEAGVPRANIAASMTHNRRGRRCNPDDLRRMVEELKKMGFDLHSMKFIHALHSFMALSKSEWVDKVQVLKKYGWSDRHIFSALEKFPKFIEMSEDKIERVMDFLVKEMGIEGTDVARYPSIIGKSLEKTIVPRCLVYKYTVEKGLCKRKLSIITLCSCTKDQFVTRIIKPYENEAPELWDLYWKLLNFNK